MIQRAKKQSLISDKSDENIQQSAPVLGQFPIENFSPRIETTGDRISEAKCFFFRNYAGLAISHLAKDRLSLDVVSNRCSGERALKASVELIGLANLGNIYSAPNLLQSARRYYGLAVNEIKVALSDPIQAV